MGKSTPISLRWGPEPSSYEFSEEPIHRKLWAPILACLAVVILDLPTGIILACHSDDRPWIGWLSPGATGNVVPRLYRAIAHAANTFFEWQRQRARGEL